MGAGVLSSSVLLAGACSDGATDPHKDPVPRILMNGPDSASARVGAEIFLGVRVVDESGTGMAGAVLVWSADSGSGEIHPARSETDASGHAGVVWTLGTGAGLQSGTVSLENTGAADAVRFSVAALPGPAERVAILADSVRLTGLGEEVVIEPTVEDRFGNVIQGEPVGWHPGDTDVFSVDEMGRVEARHPGSAVLKVSVAESSDSVQVIVAPSGAITVTFDDGWRTTYTEAFPALDELQLKANVALITGSVGWEAYLTLPQLGELDSAGWSMVSHTVHHSLLSDLSDAELEEELRESQQWILENGFSGGQVLVVPYHQWGPREREAVGNAYRAARGATATHFWPDSLVRWMPSDSYGLTAIEADSLPYTSPEGRQRLREYLQRAVEDVLFLEVFFHEVPPDRMPAFRETAQILAEFGDRVRPYHEWYGDPRVVR